MKKEKLVTGKVIYIQDLRKRYFELVKKLGRVPVIKALVTGDDYYNSVEGYNDYKSLQKGSAGLAKTAKGVKALETYLDENPPIKMPRHLKKIHIK